MQAVIYERANATRGAAILAAPRVVRASEKESALSPRAATRTLARAQRRSSGGVPLSSRRAPQALPSEGPWVIAASGMGATGPARTTAPYVGHEGE